MTYIQKIGWKLRWRDISSLLPLCEPVLPKVIPFSVLISIQEKSLSLSHEGWLFPCLLSEYARTISEIYQTNRSLLSNGWARAGKEIVWYALSWKGFTTFMIKGLILRATQLLILGYVAPHSKLNLTTATRQIMQCLTYQSSLQVYENPFYSVKRNEI